MNLFSFVLGLNILSTILCNSVIRSFGDRSISFVGALNRIGSNELSRSISYARPSFLLFLICTVSVLKLMNGIWMNGSLSVPRTFVIQDCVCFPTQFKNGS